MSSDTTYGNCTYCGQTCPHTALICPNCNGRLPWADAARKTRTVSVAPSIAPGAQSAAPQVQPVQNPTTIIPAPVPVQGMQPATNGQTFCNSCGTPNVINAAFCSGCGQALTKVMATAAPLPSAPAMWDSQPQQPQYPPQQVYGSAMPPQMPQQNVNVVVNNQTKGSNAGWWAAFLLLMFGTPLGCIGIPIMLILMAFAVPFIPIILTVGIVVAVTKMPIDSKQKPFVIAGIVITGLLLNAWLFSAMSMVK